MGDDYLMRRTAMEVARWTRLVAFAIAIALAIAGRVDCVLVFILGLFVGLMYARLLHQGGAWPTTY
jgi:hypothetical protein